MSMYNSIEYSDNYSDTSGISQQFKRDESPIMAARNPDNISTASPTSFKCKSGFFKSFDVADNGVSKNVKTAVPLKYLSNFWRSLKMPLINFKIYLEVNWTKDCSMLTIADTTFKITNTKSNFLIVTLSSKEWSEYQTKIESRNLDNNNFTRFPLDASFQGVRRLFVLAFNNTTLL